MRSTVVRDRLRRVVELALLGGVVRGRVDLAERGNGPVATLDLRALARRRGSNPMMSKRSRTSAGGGSWRRTPALARRDRQGHQERPDPRFGLVRGMLFERELIGATGRIVVVERHVELGAPVPLHTGCQSSWPEVAIDADGAVPAGARSDRIDEPSAARRQQEQCRQHHGDRRARRGTGPSADGTGEFRAFWREGRLISDWLTPERDGWSG